MIINVIWMIFNILIVSLRCHPYSKNWNRQEPGHCLPQVPIVSAVAAWGLAIELAIWALPIPTIWSLQMPRSSKVALTMIFGLGILDIGVGVARLATVLEVNELDFTWSEVPALEWLAIEPSIAILVACLCVCRPLMEKMLPAGWRPIFSSGRRKGAEYYINLIGGKNTTSKVTAGTNSASLASQTEDDRQGGAIHVKSEFDVSADHKV